MPHAINGSKAISIPYNAWHVPLPTVAGFPLPEANFVNAKMPMHVVHPRPQGETQAHARHKWAHSGMEYTIPVGVQGGAWPFVYQILEAPAGATIGQYYSDADYGVVRWSPPASGSFKFKVRIIDQDQNTITATWNVTVDDSQFVFIQDGYAGTQSGTITEPLESIADWYQGDVNDNTYHNKIIVLRGGNYTLTGDAANADGNCRLEAATKTPSIIGYPSETPIVDCASSKLVNGSSGLDDIFIAGIRWENSRQDVLNAHFHWALGVVNRPVWWDNYFFNAGPGTAGTDNTCAVFVSEKGTHKFNILYSGNVHDGFSNAAGNGSYCDFYSSSYILVEGNEAKNSTTNNGFWMKATSTFVTVRNNKAVENVNGGQIAIGYSGTSVITPPHSHEVCWNQIAIQDNASPLLWAVSINQMGATYNSFIYRNTFVGGTTTIRFVGAENYKTDGNVVVSNNLAGWDTSIMDTVDANVTGSESAGITDANGVLIGAFRTSHLGTAGHEIAEA